MTSRDGTDEHRRPSLALSEELAEGWARQEQLFERSVAPVSGRMLDALAPRPGDTVLEVAAGAGGLSFEVAELVGDAGRVVTTDLSPAILAVPHHRAAEAGQANVEVVAMDAERLDLDADAVDGVLCRFGYMLLADQAAGFSEAHRVLRPGGRLALAVWGPPQDNPFFALPARLLAEAGRLAPAGPSDPDPFSLADPALLRERLAAAGFGDVVVDEVAVAFSFRNLDRYLAFLSDAAGPIALALRQLPPDARDSLRAHIAGACAPYGSPGGYALPGLALVAAATAT